jgi:5-hydroxyisourate hydrolase-like protein (transthyretin family)
VAYFTNGKILGKTGVNDIEDVELTKINCMKNVIFLLGILFVISCTKTEVPSTPPPTPIAQEESIKFTISPDITSNNYLLNKDSLDFTISVNSKIPSQGIIYSVQVIRTDSNLTVFKLDTTSGQSSTNIKATGFNIKGSYTLKITLTSKTTSTNTINQNYTLSRNRIYKNYLSSSYDLSNYDIWFSSAQLFKSDGSKYLNNPFIDEQSAQLDIDGDGLEDLFYFEGYDLKISPTPNPPPSIFMNNGTTLKQTNYTGPSIKDPHGTKILVGDFNNDSLPDIFSNVAVDPPFGAFPFLNDNNHLILNSKNGFATVKEFPDQGFWYTGCSGDIDNDGDLDIIAFNFHNQAAGVKSRIMWNDGKANFTIDFNGIGDIPTAYQSELVDINNDGFLDLVVVFVPSIFPSRVNDFRILWGNGKGFTLVNSSSISISGEWYLMNLDFIDIDKDGTKEVIPSGTYDNPAGGAPIYFISFFKSEDKGKTYSDKTTQYIDNNKATRFYHIRVQDIDKNGMLDIFSGEKKDNIRWEWNGSKFIKK